MPGSELPRGSEMARSSAIKITDRETSGVKNSSFIYVALVFMVIALIYVWCHIHITELNYDIAREIKLRDRLLKENNELKMEIGMLKSPARIEAFARDKLQMHYPEREQVVILK